MRVAIVAESFLPETNGVVGSVLRSADHLTRRGHDVLVVAPGTGRSHVGAAEVEWIPAVSLPPYRSLAVGLPCRRVEHALARFAPDVVHAAAPVILGATGLRAARHLGIPSVAVYQTDLAGFARRYRAGWSSPAIWRWLRHVHGLADLTLAPSTAATWELAHRGIGPVAVWARGVDAELFTPARRSELLHRQLAPRGEVVVGYHGRLAAEKRVELLAGVSRLPGVRLVIVGDGPEAGRLRRRLRTATFLGFRAGPELAALVATFDVFVHAGVDETFCQAVQEAMASGVPVVAPAAGGPIDLVAHGETGLLWDPRTPGAIAGAVAELRDDPARRRRLGAAGRHRVVTRSWETIGDQLIDRYLDVVGAPDVARVA